MVKSSVSFLSLLVIFFFTGSLLRAETAELGDRKGLESVWKRSGRTTGVIDYPYSPQPGIYGGKDVRVWENRGYIFINPNVEEFRRRRAERPVAREEVPVGEADCEEIRKELEAEIARNTRIMSKKKELAEELRELRQKADDQSVKIEALEFEIEELEQAAASLPAGGTGAGTGIGIGIGIGGPGEFETGTYMVQKDDNLWKIAGKPEIYNDPYRWLLLYHANRDQIFEPDLIYPGMVLLVPRYQGLEISPAAPEGEASDGDTPLLEEELVEEE